MSPGQGVDRRSLVGSGEDGRVGVDKEEEDHAEDHEVGVDGQEDAAVIPAPGWAHAADVVDGAGYGQEGGQDEEGSGVDLREVGHGEGDRKAEQNEDGAAEEGAGTRVEQGWFHLSKA